MIPSRVLAVTDYVFPAFIAALSRDRGPATRRIMQIGPVWHIAYTLLTRHEGGLVPALSMRPHPACDSAAALGFVGAAALLKDEFITDRMLLAALCLSELVLIALSEREVPGEAQER